MARRRTHRISTITLNTGRGAHATNHPYPARPPVLALDFGALSVLPPPRPVTWSPPPTSTSPASSPLKLTASPALWNVPSTAWPTAGE